VSQTKLPEWLSPRLLTVPEVSDVLRLSERQVWRLISDGRLRVMRVGRRVVIRPEAVIALLENK
jgi:excisionase family DNA binding protein